MAIVKKTVSSSNLALRFYKTGGWTREDIEPHILCDSLTDTEDKFGDEPRMAYYVLDVGTELDMDRFYREQVKSVSRAFDDYPEETDLEFLKRMNW